MLFNSYEFIFLFLPVVLAGYYLVARLSPNGASVWLALASLVFYGWWTPRFIPLLSISIAANYSVGLALSRVPQSARKATLITGLVFNLALLGYYKYAGFLVSFADQVTGASLPIPEILLPLGISFFTFTQIAFLVDVYRGKAREYRPIHYVLFVTFFPHLIAGPILHHKEMMPQFARLSSYRLRSANFAVGLTIFAIGLAKKTVIADTLSPFVAQTFDAASHGAIPGTFEAWGGALGYTLQLYFDFSGYSDMAIGLARLFGIKMPINFYSPYKADSIIEFWRRWHMTLSRFLRDYLYIPLGGNRHGTWRRYANVMVTMLLGGLWHGAGWTFVVWGGLHGCYLVFNHGWRALHGSAPLSRPMLLAARLLTFLSVVFAWTVFRADSLAAAGRVVAGMVGASGAGWTLPSGHWDRGYSAIAVGLALIWLAPNTSEIMARYAPVLPFDRAVRSAREPGFTFRWRATPSWAYAVSVVASLGLLYLSRIAEFLYFRF